MKFNAKYWSREKRSKGYEADRKQNKQQNEVEYDISKRYFKEEWFNISKKQAQQHCFGNMTKKCYFCKVLYWIANENCVKNIFKPLFEALSKKIFLVTSF